MSAALWPAGKSQIRFRFNFFVASFYKALAICFFRKVKERNLVSLFVYGDNHPFANFQNTRQLSGVGAGGEDGPPKVLICPKSGQTL